MAVPATAVYVGGIACTPDGAVYVEPTGSASITGGNVGWTLVQTAIPFIHLSTGSVDANGAISAITALPNAYPNAYCWFPANVLATTIAAGWHYCTFSTTTAGTAFLDTYSTGIPGIPASPSAVTDGKGAFTGSTTDIDSVQVVLPAGSLLENGSLRIRTSWAMTNNANAKTGNVRIATTGITPGTSLASFLNIDNEYVVMNRGRVDRQVSAPNASAVYGLGTSPSARLYGTVNFALAQTLKAFITKGVATDNVVLESLLIEVRQKGPT